MVTSYFGTVTIFNDLPHASLQAPADALECVASAEVGLARLLVVQADLEDNLQLAAFALEFLSGQQLNWWFCTEGSRAGSPTCSGGGGIRGTMIICISSATRLFNFALDPYGQSPLACIRHGRRHHPVIVLVGLVLDEAAALLIDVLVCISCFTMLCSWRVSFTSVMMPSTVFALHMLASSPSSRSLCVAVLAGLREFCSAPSKCLLKELLPLWSTGGGRELLWLCASSTASVATVLVTLDPVSGNSRLTPQPKSPRGDAAMERSPQPSRCRGLR